MPDPAPPPNLPLPDARAAVLAALKAGPKTRAELKAAAPYGNYTALCRGLEADGLIRPDPADGGGPARYALAPKGKKGGA